MPWAGGKVRRCPKCGSIPARYQEVWTGHTITFDADADGYPEPEGDLNEGEPSCVWAACRCGHKWRLKGVIQITDLRKERSLG